MVGTLGDEKVSTIMHGNNIYTNGGVQYAYPENCEQLVALDHFRKGELTVACVKLHVKPFKSNNITLRVSRLINPIQQQVDLWKQRESWFGCFCGWRQFNTHIRRMELVADMFEELGL